MELIKGGAQKEQRRIIVEAPQLIWLFDFYSSLLQVERDNGDDVLFGEMESDMSFIITELVKSVVERIDKKALTSLVVCPKTGESTVKDEVVQRIINAIARADKDSVITMLEDALKLTLSEVVKDIVDELIRESGFNSFNKLSIKTRRHVVVLC